MPPHHALCNPMKFDYRKQNCFHVYSVTSKKVNAFLNSFGKFNKKPAK